MMCKHPRGNTYPPNLYKNGIGVCRPRSAPGAGGAERWTRASAARPSSPRSMPTIGKIRELGREEGSAVAPNVAAGRCRGGNSSSGRCGSPWTSRGCLKGESRPCSSASPTWRGSASRRTAPPRRCPQPCRRLPGHDVDARLATEKKGAHNNGHTHTPLTEGQNGGKETACHLRRRAGRAPSWPMLAAVLHGRPVGPALERPHQRPGLEVAQRKGDLVQAQVGIRQQVLGEVAPCMSSTSSR